MITSDPLPVLENCAPNVIAQAACEYIEAGFCPIPVLPRSKNPGREGWQNLRVALAEVPQLFLHDANIGLLLGSAGNGLCDFDLDCAEAVALAPTLLPRTHFTSGRPSNPLSHYWYKGNPVPAHKSFEFAGEKLVELRTVGQTIVPPSLYENGEQLCWTEAHGEPPTVAGDVLSRVAAELAAASLVIRHYPKQGSRHQFAMALAGFLLRQPGWDTARVTRFVVAVATVADDDEMKDRENAVETTAERLAAGGKALGGTRFREIVGNAVFDKFCEWLGFAKIARVTFSELPLVESAAVANNALEPWPQSALEGDYIADLTDLLTDGTPIPKQFVREEIVLSLGSLADQILGYPSHPDLMSRRYLALISERPQAGKGESWKRVGGKDGVLRFFLETAGVKVLNASGIGSGQYLAKVLEETPRTVAVWDEASQLFQQTGQQNCTLLSALKSLYEDTSHWTGSFTNKKYGTDDAHLSVLLQSTRKTFVQGFSIRGGMGDGLLSRFTFSYADKWAVMPTWESRDYTRERPLAEKIIDLIPTIQTTPAIDDQARKRMTEFAHEINGSERPHPEHTPRLLEHAKVDVLMRAIFSGSPTITIEHVERSIAWARYQLRLRLEFWPPDAEDRVTAMIQTLLRRLRMGRASACDLRRAANVSRDGNHETFSRALSALTRSGELVVLGKNRKGKEVFGLESDEIDGDNR